MGARLRYLPGVDTSCLDKGVILHRSAQQQVGIPRRRDVAFVQAAGVGEGGAGAADGFSLRVHHCDKVVDAAAAHIVGHDVGGFVAGLHLHRIEQRAQGVGFAAANVSTGSPLAVEIIIDIPGRGDRDGIELVLIVFEQQDHCHQFGQAAGDKRGFAVFLVDDEVGIEVDDVGGLGRNLKIRVIAGHRRRGGGQRRRQQHDRQRGRKDFFECMQHGQSSLVGAPRHQSRARRRLYKSSIPNLQANEKHFACQILANSSRRRSKTGVLPRPKGRGAPARRGSDRPQAGLWPPAGPP